MHESMQSDILQCGSKLPTQRPVNCFYQHGAFKTNFFSYLGLLNMNMDTKKTGFMLLHFFTRLFCKRRGKQNLKLWVCIFYILQGGVLSLWFSLSAEQCWRICRIVLWSVILWPHIYIWMDYNVCEFMQKERKIIKINECIQNILINI